MALRMKLIDSWGGTEPLTFFNLALDAFRATPHTEQNAINVDGTKKWGFETGDGIASPPAIGSDGTIYVGSDDKKLYAIGAAK